MLGPNPTQERFRLAAYYLTDLAFEASGDGLLGWGEFMERYTAMYPRGQPGLPNDPVTAYVNNLRAIGTAPGSATTRGTRTTRRRDPHAGVQRLRGLFIEQLRTVGSTAPQQRRQSAACAARRTRGGETPARRRAGPSTPRA
jgi:hypothetical protein